MEPPGKAGARFEPVGLAKLLDPDHVVFLRNVPTKNELLTVLAHRLARLDGLADPDRIVADLLRRESENSTGVGHRVAIPHLATDGDRSHVLAALVDPPVDYAAFDGRPIDLAFLILTPRDRPAEYLHLLAEIARVTRDPARAERLRSAPDPEAFLDRLREGPAGVPPPGKTGRG